jgi:hypothetical protein
VIEPGVGTQVLITGAGPAGLTLACELTRRGIHCLVAEKDQKPAAGSRGKGLQPRTQEIFEDLGILPEVRARGGLYPPLQARSGGTVVFEGRMDPLRPVTPDVPYPNLWMLPQWQTAGILHARLASLGGRVEFGSELESFRQDPGGVTAILRRGDSARQVRPTTWWVQTAGTALCGESWASASPARHGTTSGRSSPTFMPTVSAATSGTYGPRPTTRTGTSWGCARCPAPQHSS